ncbi:hypothetical protein [Salinimicrobium soli]
MKNLLFGLLLMCFVGVGHSQIVLDETRLEYKPVSLKMDPVNHELVVKVKEKAYGEFQKDPLAFVKNHFNVQQFIRDNEKLGYDSYEIVFKNRAGQLFTTFDNKGELIGSRQRFKNVPIPDDTKLAILEKYRDAKILSNRYAAYSKSWNIEKEVYKVKLQDGDKVRRLKIQRDAQGITLAGL